MGKFGDIFLMDYLVVFEYDDVVVMVEDFLEVMGDEDDVDIFLLQLVEEGKQLFVFVECQCCCGFVEDQDVGIGCQCFEDIDDFLFVGVEVVVFCIDIDIDVEFFL